MDELLIIKINKIAQTIKVFNEYGSMNEIEYNEDFKINWERHDDYCMDFNDNAKWLMLTILEIMKAEKKDDYMHWDWSAEDKYDFSVKLTKKGEQND